MGKTPGGGEARRGSSRFLHYREREEREQQEERRLQRLRRVPTTRLAPSPSVGELGKSQSAALGKSGVGLGNLITLAGAPALEIILFFTSPTPTPTPTPLTTSHLLLLPLKQWLEPPQPLAQAGIIRRLSLPPLPDSL